MTSTTISTITNRGRLRSLITVLALLLPSIFIFDQSAFAAVWQGTTSWSQQVANDNTKVTTITVNSLPTIQNASPYFYMHTSLTSSNLAGWVQATATCPSTGAVGSSTSQVSGTAYDMATGGVQCAAGSSTIVVRLYSLDSAGGSATLKATYDPAYVPPPVATGTEVCANLTDARAGYDGTSLAVTFKAAGTLPASWALFDPLPTQGASNTVIATIPTTATVDGQPGYYYWKGTPSNTVTAGDTVELTAGTTWTQSACSVGLKVSSNLPIAGASTTDKTDHSGSDCSISWNILSDVKCALDWAFHPSQTDVDGWHSRIDSIEAHPPTNFMVGGYDLITQTLGNVDCQVTNTTGTNAQCPEGSSINHPIVPTTFDGPDPGNTTHVNFLSSASDMMQNNPWGHIVFTMLVFGVWGIFIIAAIQRIRHSLGGRE